MSVAIAPQSSQEVLDDYSHYRALSVLAVASCLFGVLSVLAFLSWTLAVIPLLGVVMGLVAVQRVRSNSTELTGERFAWIGIALSVLFFAAGWGYLTYAYVTELPPGYERLSYAELQPDPDVQGEVYPPAVADLNGRRVFIKGYIYPGKQTSSIKQFVLCRDNGDCCFGGQPKLTDRIMVTLAAPLSLDYTTKLQRLAGTFRVEPGQATDGLGGAIYHLDADYLK